MTERNPYNERDLALDHGENGQGAHERVRKKTCIDKKFRP